MAARRTRLFQVLAYYVDEAVGIDAQQFRGGARMNLSCGGRACSAARLVAAGVQHLAQTLQSTRGLV